MDRFFVTGWLFVIIGALAIGIGGFLTTSGWNRLNQHSQMKSLIIAIAREWEINNTLLKDPLFTSPDENMLGSYRLYPRFKVSALNNALISGLFSSSYSKDREFLRIIADYEATISDINSRLNVSDNFVISTRDIAAIANHRRYIVQSPGFQGLLKQHERVKDFIDKNHCWAMKAKFLN
jgi:hypothetical protein